MSVRVQIIGSSLMNGYRHLRHEREGRVTARTCVGEVEVVGADLTAPDFGEVKRIAGGGDRSEPGKIQLRRAEGVRREKVIDGVTGDVVGGVGVERANV